MNKGVYWLGILAAGVLLGWGVGHWGADRHDALEPVAVQLAEAPTGGDFTLDSADGPLSLRDLRGKAVLLYFGYTACPDICPTSLAAIAQALSLLNPQELDNVRVLFVSVDPERDTPEQLRTYTHYFHPAMIGLTGSREAIDRAVQRYGAAYRKQEVASAGGYVVDHSASTYVIAPDGTLRSILPHGASPAEVAEAARAALAQSRTAPKP